MRIALIDGSPKPKRSVSGRLLDWVQEGLPADAEQVRARITEEDDYAALYHRAIKGSDAFVMAFPLYFDSLPNEVISFYEAVEREAASEGAALPRLYVIVNCGLYDAIQCRFAVAMSKVFARKAGMPWGRAISVGGGPMANFEPKGEGFLMKAGKAAVDDFAATVAALGTDEDIMVEPDCSRDDYHESSHQGWFNVITKRGGDIEDLRALPQEYTGQQA
jgi:hypothetical protein